MRWDGVQPGQTDVMLLGFNTTIKRLEDQEGQCVFELQEGLVRLTNGTRNEIPKMSWCSKDLPWPAELRT